MRLGLRFNAGPLTAWVPLSGRQRSDGGLIVAAVYLMMILLAVAFVVCALALVWPYLAARYLGPRLGWPRQRATAVGVGATAVWVVIGLIVHAVTA